MGCNPFPQAAGLARVSYCKETAPDVFELAIERRLEESSIEIPKPQAGQFFMLKAAASSVFLMRPVSALFCDESTIRFLIQRKGEGTHELCSLREGERARLLGPSGRGFPLPNEIKAAVSPQNESSPPRVALIGGGIGVAPVAYLSSFLAEKSFDLLAAFRSSPYGIAEAAARALRVFIASEDGSSGVKGMLPSIFNPLEYDLVYACGPLPMLKYVKAACAGHSARAFLSMESRMACGAGACLGCAVKTQAGNRRCCVDGPVFPAEELAL